MMNECRAPRRCYVTMHSHCGLVVTRHNHLPHYLSTQYIGATDFSWKCDTTALKCFANLFVANIRKSRKNVHNRIFHLVANQKFNFNCRMTAPEITYLQRQIWRQVKLCDMNRVYCLKYILTNRKLNRKRLILSIKCCNTIDFCMCEHKLLNIFNPTANFRNVQYVTCLSKQSIPR